MRQRMLTRELGWLICTREEVHVLIRFIAPCRNPRLLVSLRACSSLPDNSCLALHQLHRSHILEPALEHIINHSNDQSPAKHHARPIHGLRRNRRHNRPSEEEDQRRQQHQRRAIDRQPPSSQRPSSRRQLRPSDPPIHNAANRQEIRDQHRDRTQRRDSIQRHRRAKIDQRAKRRDCKRDHHSRNRDIPPGRDLRQPRVARHPGIAGERPQLARGGGDFGHGASGEHEQNDGCHCVCGGVGLG